MQKTIDWVDNAKAACIFLVVWGHFYAINPEAKALIYSVHLPAFLFVTGFLAGEGMLKNPLRWLLLEQERFYVLAYAFFTILASVLWYALEARQHPLSEILRPLKGGLLGLHGPGLNLVHNDDPLWYFPFLITSTAFGYALLKLPMPVALPVCFVSAGLLSLLNVPPLPWSLDLAPIGATFILLGVALRTRSDVLSRPAFRDKKYIFLALLAWLPVALFNGQINMNSRAWGASWFLFVVAAIAGIYLLLRVCSVIPATTIAQGLSRNTLVIFCVHVYFVKVLNKLIARLPTSLQSWAVVVAAAIITLVCWRISRLVQPVLFRWLKSNSPRPLRQT